MLFLSMHTDDVETSNLFLVKLATLNGLSMITCDSHDYESTDIMEKFCWVRYLDFSSF